MSPDCNGGEKRQMENNGLNKLMENRSTSVTDKTDKSLYFDRGNFCYPEMKDTIKERSTCTELLQSIYFYKGLH